MARVYQTISLSNWYRSMFLEIHNTGIKKNNQLHCNLTTAAVAVSSELLRHWKFCC
jgi:hypothetical protein